MAMEIDWQQAVALGLVALAAAYIGRRAWRRFLSNSMCAACAGCGDGKAEQTLQGRTIVPIESLTQANSPIGDTCDAPRMAWPSHG